MAERNDWDRNRDREQEIDRERGGHRLDTPRRESRGYDASRWENEGGRYESENQGRGNFPRYEDRSRDYGRDYGRDYRGEEYRGDDYRRERGEWSGGSRTADFGHRGDWGRQGNWGTYGNRPNYDERGQYTGQWASRDRGGEFFRQSDEGVQHNQMGGMSAGHSSGMWSSGSGAGYGGGYSGGMGSYSGGFGRYSEQGRHAGRGPKNWQRSDERIREEVNERLTDHPHIDATEIDVQVKSGEVTLTGTVENRHIKRMAEDLAEGVSGVREVHNQLRAQGAVAQQTEMAHSAGSPASGGTQVRR